MAGFELIKRLGKILRIGGSELERFAIEGEFQRLGVQGRTTDQVGFWGTVLSITKDREPQREGMYAHLVRPPGGRYG